MKIECPSNGGSAQECLWQQRVGQVRDFPSVGLFQCQECKLVTHAKDLSSDVNYESGSMHNWAQGYGDSLPGPATDSIRRLRALKELARDNGIKTVLDFGCGSGGMLQTLSNDFEVIGLEPDRQARETSIKNGFVVYESAENAIASNVQVDAVTLFHVVEHFYDASLELGKILALLRPGGLMIIETPNSMDALLSMYQSEDFSKFTYWSHHPMLHSHESLSRLVKRSGFSVTENNGIQRYDLNNHLYWLSNGQPGGHERWRNFAPDELNNSYANFLVELKICDTLWLVAHKT